MRSMFFVLLVVLPLAAMLIGWFAGKASVRKAFFFLVGWFVICEIVLVVSVTMAPYNVLALAVATLALFAMPAGILMAVLYSFLSSEPVNPPPARVAAQATVEAAGKAKSIYDGLDEDNKRRVGVAFQWGLKIALAGFADFLHRKESHSAAGVARSASKSL